MLDVSLYAWLLSLVFTLYPFSNARTQLPKFLNGIFVLSFLFTLRIKSQFEGFHKISQNLLDTKKYMGKYSETYCTTESPGYKGSLLL